MSPSGVTRSDSFSTPFAAAAQYAAFAGIDQPARRRSNFLSTTLRNTLIPMSNLRQLGDDLDLHEESRIHQTLHLHP